MHSKELEDMERLELRRPHDSHWDLDVLYFGADFRAASTMVAIV
ncbi:MAG TPA: hypothetical protein VEX68_19695 [Bryobacteraceae bacterium]|nr:hypothetical protein [Bryobacteraceae bacterium]